MNPFLFFSLTTFTFCSKDETEEVWLEIKQFPVDCFKFLLFCNSQFQAYEDIVKMKIDENRTEFFSKDSLKNILQNIDKTPYAEIIITNIDKIFKKYTPSKKVADMTKTKLKTVMNDIFLTILNFYIENTNNELIELQKTEERLEEQDLKNKDNEKLNWNWSYKSCEIYGVVIELMNTPIIFRNFALENPIHEYMPINKDYSSNINFVGTNFVFYKRDDLKMEKSALIFLFERENSRFLNYTNHLKIHIENTKKTLIDLYQTESNNETKFDELIKLNVKMPEFSFNLDFLGDIEKDVNLSENVRKAVIEVKNSFLKISKFLNSRSKYIESLNKFIEICRNETNKDKDGFIKDVTSDFNKYMIHVLYLKYKFDLSNIDPINIIMTNLTDAILSAEIINTNKNKIIDRKSMISQDMNDLKTVLVHIFDTDINLYKKIDLFKKLYFETNTPVDDNKSINFYEKDMFFDPVKTIEFLKMLIQHFLLIEERMVALTEMQSEISRRIEKFCEVFDENNEAVKIHFNEKIKLGYSDLLKLYVDYMSFIKTIYGFIQEYSKNINKEKTLLKLIEDDEKIVGALENEIEKMGKICDPNFKKTTDHKKNRFLKQVLIVVACFMPNIILLIFVLARKGYFQKN